MGINLTGVDQCSIPLTGIIDNSYRVIGLGKDRIHAQYLCICRDSPKGKEDKKYDFIQFHVTVILSDGNNVNWEIYIRGGQLGCDCLPRLQKKQLDQLLFL